MPVDLSLLPKSNPRLFQVIVFTKRLRTKIGLFLVIAGIAETLWFRERPVDPHRMGTLAMLGTAMVIGGLAVRLVALGSLVKKRRLATTGVYSLCRHPLYLGSILIGMGFCMLFNDWHKYIAAAAYFVLFYPLAIVWEEVRLSMQFGEQHRTYRWQTPCLLPLGRFQANRCTLRRAIWRGGATNVIVAVILLALVEVLAHA